MSLFFIIIYLAVGAIIFFAVLVLMDMVRTKGKIARALNMSLFLVTLPKENSQQQPTQQLIGVMEKLYASFANIHAWGWNKFAYGDPYLALEMAVPHSGDEIHFYMAVPRSYEPILQKQVQEFYPQIKLERVRDYNIFNHRGVVTGGYIALQEHPILPFRTYARLEHDPLSQIAAALSKLEREGEGTAIQILIRPSHRQDIPALAQKVAREMELGHDFKEALSRAQSYKMPARKEAALAEVSEDNSVRTTVELMQSKATRPLFDTNIRIIVSAGDEARAHQILSDVTNSFTQFGGPKLNGFQTNLSNSKALEKLIFDFSFRMFDMAQVVSLSSEELASLYHFPLSSASAFKFKSHSEQVVVQPS